jgi:geranylgeranylglycerol-phosphate geranylgeranyltransferase
MRIRFPLVHFRFLFSQYHLGKRFWYGLLRVTHPDGWLQGALYMLLGCYLRGGLESLQSPTVIRALGVVGLVIAAGFAFNDFQDEPVDRINKPGRAIPSGQIPRSAAIVLALLLTIAAIVLAWSLSPILLTMTIVNIMMSDGYSLFLKRTPIFGHLTIAYLNTTIILFGCMVIGAPTLVIWLVSLSGFFFTLAQETILAAEDHLGDRLTGLQTTAVYFGIGTTLYFFRIFAILSIVIMLMPWMLSLASNLYLYALLPCTILPITVALHLVTPKFTDLNIRLSSKLILWSRATSLLPVLLLGVSRSLWI